MLTKIDHLQNPSTDYESISFQRAVPWGLKAS